MCSHNTFIVNKKIISAQFKKTSDEEYALSLVVQQILQPSSLPFNNYLFIVYHHGVGFDTCKKTSGRCH